MLLLKLLTRELIYLSEWGLATAEISDKRLIFLSSYYSTFWQENVFTFSGWSLSTDAS